MKVEKTRKMTGFTLVEMLVVIAIIAILASALFPAIQNAMGQAQATAMKNKGRGIWVAVTSANMEREPLSLGALWPEELKKEGLIEGKTDSYFTYLMSDGEGKESKLADTTDDQVVSDLTTSSLIANGVTPASGDTLKAENIAWSVCEVGDNTPAEIPFLFSRNMITETIEPASGGNAKHLTLSNEKPFGSTRAVWVTRGGGVFDARRKYLTNKQILGEMTNRVDVWVYSGSEGGK